MIGKYTQPALTKAEDTNQPPEAAKGVLVMPFDVRQNHAGFQIVNTLGVGRATPIGTHWTYWGEDGQFLAEAFICLRPLDTVVTDPTIVQSQTGVTGDNISLGDVISLSGVRGFVVVTAYGAPDLGPSGQGCGLNSGSTPIDDVLVGNWIMANTVDNSAVGGEALGFAQSRLPDTSETGRSVFTLDPDDLTGSLVTTIGLQLGAGPRGELAPIPRTSAALGGMSVCCQVEIVGDSSSDKTSLPNICFNAASFRPLTQSLAGAGDVPLVPPSIPLDRGGYVRFNNCLTANADGTIAGLGEGDSNQAFFAVHSFIGAAR